MTNSFRRGFRKSYEVYAVRTAPDEPEEPAVVGLISVSGEYGAVKVSRIYVHFGSRDGRSIRVREKRERFFYGNKELLGNNMNNPERAEELFERWKQIYAQELPRDAARSLIRNDGPVRVPLEIIGISGQRSDLLQAMIEEIEASCELLSGLKPVEDASLARCPYDFRERGRRMGGILAARERKYSSDRIKLANPRIMSTPWGGDPRGEWNR